MKKWMKAGLIMGMVGCSGAIEASEQSASVDLMQALSQYKTFQARFKQQTVSANNKVMANSRGRCYIERPNLFRWETRSPSNQVVIGDGRFVWVYDVDLMQATQRPVSPNQWSPVKLLMGDADSLNRFFHVSESTRNNQRVFLLTKKQKDQLFQRVQFIFKQNKLQQLLVTNSLNQLATFTFSRAQYNKKIARGLFSFKPKPGVDVIHVKS